jgi:hypothetical protein
MYRLARGRTPVQPGGAAKCCKERFAASLRLAVTRRLQLEKNWGRKANDTAEAAIGLHQDPRRANEEYAFVKPLIDIIPSLA